MINIKNVKVYGLEESKIRSGYPMTITEPDTMNYDQSGELILGDNTDKVERRSFKLSNVPSGSGHNNFLKGIIVQFDLQYPEYFSPQLQRYNWVDIVSSQSKMHKITSRELTRDDFNSKTSGFLIWTINKWIKSYNEFTNECYPYLAEKTSAHGALIINNKQEHFQLIMDNLPSGYLKWMGITTNYLQLKTIYKQRENHKLKEWRQFCDWIAHNLPDCHLIT